MKSTVSRTILPLLVAAALALGVLTAPSYLYAQWSLTAPDLLGVQGNQMGAITHKGGVSWAVSNQLVFMSRDSGKTWTQKFQGGVSIGDNIDDVNFFDDQIGIICTNRGNVYLTTDQGTTWTHIHSSTGAKSATFLSNPASILIATGGGNTIDITQDGGNTWSNVKFSNWVPCVKPLIGGSALLLTGNNDSLQMYRSTDYGQTWTPSQGWIGHDSYSFDVIPCEPEHIIAINEAGSDLFKNSTNLFLTNDGGNTWTTPISQVLSSVGKVYFCGSVSMTSRAIFVQTIKNGILRSIDQGVTWQKIGGPSNVYDTRLVFAISPNIVLAADSNGSIWRTINSGGDSITNIKPYEGLSINPLELFLSDTLTNCDSPVIESAIFKAQLCSSPKIDTQFISGPDSLDYHIVKGMKDSLPVFDSILISFKPRGSGDRIGNYVLVLVDGTHIIVPLHGYGRNVTFVETLSQSITLDTIGGFANVPIRVRGLPRKENIDFILHYDPKLRYAGTYSLPGKRIDDQSNSWAGRSKLDLDSTNLQLDTVSAFAVFEVYPDGDTCFKASIDSMTILNPLAPCLYSLGPDVPVEICPPFGCGIMTITNFLLHHRYPIIVTVPNPSPGTASVQSTKDIGNCKIIIVDALGREVTREEKNIERGTTVLYDNLPTGNYFIRIFTDTDSWTLPLTVLQ